MQPLMPYEEETVPCEWCGMATVSVYDRMCDGCWELRHRILSNPARAVEMLVTYRDELGQGVKLQIWYGLRWKKTNRTLSVYTESNEPGEFCTSVAHKFADDEDEPPWLVDTKEDAEKARVTNTKWFNAGYRTPMNSFDPEELEVVEVVLITKKAKEAK